MTWLDTDIKSSELSSSHRANEITTKSDRYFEFDNETTGVDIEGYIFFPKKVEGVESHSHREFLRTKIMAGGEFVTRGQYIPREFSFDTIIDINPDDLDKYYDIFYEMENKACNITSPYMGGMFKGEVTVSVTNPEASPHVLECKITIKEIPDIMARLKGDPVIQYPSINTISDVSVREREVKKTKSTTEEEDVQRYDAPTSSDSQYF